MLHALFPWFECNIWGFYFFSLFRKHPIWLALQVLLAVYPHLQLLKRLTGFYWCKLVLIEVRGHYLYHSKQGFQLFLGCWQTTELFLPIRPDASFFSENSKCAEFLWTCSPRIFWLTSLGCSRLQDRHLLLLAATGTPTALHTWILNLFLNEIPNWHLHDCYTTFHLTWWYRSLYAVFIQADVDFLLVPWTHCLARKWCP